MKIRTIAAILALSAVTGCTSTQDAEQAALEAKKAADQATAAAQQANQAAQQAGANAQQMAAGAQAAGQGAQQGAQQFAAGMQQLAQGLQQMSAAQGDTVNHEVLKGLLPQTLSGWTLETSRSEQVTMPFKVSNAQGRYRNGASSLDVQINDASLNQLALAPLSMFLVSGYSEVSSDGHKKYSAVNGMPGFEEWRKNNRRAELTVVVANRFIVNATGHDVDSVDPVRAAIQSLDLARLATLK
jgi:X-X-X-Leu-X-X-Gly heptad repeat protein